MLFPLLSHWLPRVHVIAAISFFSLACSRAVVCCCRILFPWRGRAAAVPFNQRPVAVCISSSCKPALCGCVYFLPLPDCGGVVGFSRERFVCVLYNCVCWNYPRFVFVVIYRKELLEQDTKNIMISYNY